MMIVLSASSVIGGEVDLGDPGGRYPGGRGRNEGMKRFGRHHEGVTKHMEVCGVAHFFGEDVTWPDRTRDVVEIHFLGLDAVADGAVFEADVAYALGGGALGPVDSALVIVV